MERPRWKANANLSPRRRAASWVATSCLWLALSVVLPWTTGEGVQAAFPPPVFESSVFNPFGLSNAGPYSIPRFVDIDGDGDLDAFVGVALGDEFFLANTGSATSPAFASPVADPFGLASIGGFAAPAFADIDGDGDFDLFVGKGLGGIEFFANTGTAVSPAFASPSPNPFGLSGTFRYTVPAFVDIDGDGDLDGMMGLRSGGLLLFTNSGSVSSPAFASPVLNPFGLVDVGYLSAPAIADLDGDGDLDAFVGLLYGQTVLFQNTGTPTSPAFASPSADPYGITDVGFAGKPSFADLDGDGDLDAIVGESFGSLRFFKSAQNPRVPPSFDAPVAVPFGIGDVGSEAVPTAANLDGDGDPDVLMGDSAGGTVFLANSGTRTGPAFAAPVESPFGLGAVGTGSAPTFADLDRDGDLDGLIGDDAGGMTFFLNTGTAVNPLFGAASLDPFGLTDVGDGSVPRLADIDGDGDLDAFVGDAVGSTWFSRNTGTATSAAFDVPSANPFGLIAVAGNGAPCFADVDGDGDLDAVIGDATGSTSFFRNTGNATNPAFLAPLTERFGLSVVGPNAAVAFVDIDGDGDLDALVSESGGTTSFFRNRSHDRDFVFGDRFESSDLSAWSTSYTGL